MIRLIWKGYHTKAKYVIIKYNNYGGLSMSLEEIIEDIKRGLKGNPIEDMSYLKEQTLKYNGHEYQNEIDMAIGKLSLEAVTNKDNNISKEKLEEEAEEIKKSYEKAVRLCNDKRFKDAGNILEEIIDKIRNKSEAGNTYFSFGSALNLWLYTLVFDPKQMINQSLTDNSSIYKLYAYTLAQTYKIDEAIASLEEGLKWEPVNVSILLELGEISRLRGEYEKFLGATKNAIIFSLSSHELSICYCRLAIYFEEIKDYRTAICLYHLSNSFERNIYSARRLDKMRMELGLKVEVPSNEKMNRVLKEKDIPLGPSEYVISAITSLAKNSKENGSIEIYRFCKDTYKDLTGEDL